MHEFSIAQNIVDIVTEKLDNHEFETVISVNVEVGEMSSVVPSALEFSFQVASESTPLEGAGLELKEIPLKVYCEKCDSNFSPQAVFNLVCPKCKDPNTEITQGDDLQVVSINCE